MDGIPSHFDSFNHSLCSISIAVRSPKEENNPLNRLLQAEREAALMIEREQRSKSELNHHYFSPFSRATFILCVSLSPCLLGFR